MWSGAEVGPGEMLLAKSKTEHGFELQLGAFQLDFFIRQQ
jgi:hypothetical protein